MWVVLVPQEAKIGTESREYTAREHSQRSTTDFEVISEIHWAKFWILVIYIFGDKIWFSDTNFRSHPPGPPNMEVPPPPPEISM